MSEGEGEWGLNHQLHHNKSKQTMADAYQCQLLLHEYISIENICSIRFWAAQ